MTTGPNPHRQKEEVELLQAIYHAMKKIGEERNKEDEQRSLNAIEDQLFGSSSSDAATF